VGQFETDPRSREGREGPLDPALPFLPKPWTSVDLLARVRQVLDAAKQS
jgi:hypothetical protein